MLAATCFDRSGQRGGFVNWDAIEFDLRLQFTGDSDPNLRFSTLLDVYAMPTRVLALADFEAPVTVVADINAVERAIEGVFSESRFKAYLQRHELEAPLLANLDSLERVFHRHTVGIRRLRTDIAGFASAEEINDGPTTHPSARLAIAIPGYQDLKASHAYFVLAEGGLDASRVKCPRFDDWLKYWESWGAQPS